MLRTKKLKKTKKKARSKAIKFGFMVAGVVALGIFCILAVVAFWPSGSSSSGKKETKKPAVKKTVKKEVKKKAPEPVKEPAKKTPPPLVIDEPQPDVDIPQTTVTIKGSTSPGTALLLDGQKYEIRADGTFSINVELVRGINRFFLTAVSPQGLKTEKEIVVNCTAASKTSGSKTSVP